VVLQWSSATDLAAGEYYVVRIPYDTAGGVAEFWRTERSLQVPANFSSKDVGFLDRRYTWSVQVMRCTANCDKVLDDQARKQGDAVGPASSLGDFYWYPDIGGPVATPTRS